VIFVDADSWYLIGAGLNNTAFMLKEISVAMQNQISKVQDLFNNQRV